MDTQILTTIHFTFFIVFFIAFAFLEYYFPLREKTSNIKKRWTHNLSLSFLNTIIIRFLVFVTPVSFALIASENNWGLFNVIEIPLIAEIIIAVIILDFFIYLQHIASHKWKWFWTFHQIHHSDSNLDVTTALRFHFGEMLLSLGFKILLVAIFGFSAISIITFEILLVVSTMFNHANIHLPKHIDKLISKIFITPQFHQVHHSAIPTQTDSNYGFFLSIWDHLFNTHTPHNFFVKKLGLNYTKKELNLIDLLLLKMRGK